MLEVVIGPEKWVLVAPAPDRVQLHSGFWVPLAGILSPEFQQCCTGQKSVQFYRMEDSGSSQIWF